MIYLSFGLLGLSLVINALLLFAYYRKRAQKIEYTYDAKALMRDLATGPAIVKMEYLDRSEILIRSPRHL